MTRARGRRWARALGVLALFVLAFWLTGCDPAVFWARRAHLRDIVSQLFPPDWSYLSAIVAPLLATLRMSVTGTALGVLLALILAPLCAANLPCPAPVRRILRFLVQVLRSFPALILALLATFLFGLGTFSGTVAITLFTLAVMTRMTYEDIETLTLAPYRALCAMGASPARAYARAVVPEIASGYLTNALYLLETNVRHSAILGYVGAGGIGLLLNEKISWREYGRVGAILVCLFVTVCCNDSAATATPRRHTQPLVLSPIRHTAQRLRQQPQAHHPRRAQHPARGKVRDLGGGARVRRRLHGGHRSAGSGAHE